MYFHENNNILFITISLLLYKSHAPFNHHVSVQSEGESTPYTLFF